MYVSTAGIDRHTTREGLRPGKAAVGEDELELRLDEVAQLTAGLQAHIKNRSKRGSA